MAERLNDRRIAALPVPTVEQRQRDCWDETLRGFGELVEAIARKRNAPIMANRTLIEGKTKKVIAFRA